MQEFSFPDANPHIKEAGSHVSQPHFPPKQLLRPPSDFPRNYRGRMRFYSIYTVLLLSGPARPADGRAVI